MAFPFFQGNVNDLLDVAGAGQGSFALGQMMKAQRDQQAEELQKSYLANMLQKQQMEQEQQMFPYKMQEQGARISNMIRTGEGMDLGNKKAQNELGVFDASGGVEGAAGDIKETRQAKKFENAEKMREAFNDALLQTEWGPDIENRLMSTLTEFQVPEQHASRILGLSRNQQSWDQMRQRLFESSRASRMQAQKDAADLARAESVAKIGSEGRTQQAIIRSQQQAMTLQEALFKAKKASEKHALLLQAAMQAEQDGRPEDAARYRMIAEQLRPQAEAELQATPRPGTTDPSSLGVPTNPPRSIAPPGQPQGQAKRQVWTRENGVLKRVE